MRVLGENHAGSDMVLSPIFLPCAEVYTWLRMSCEERERLTKIYLAAVAKNNESASAKAGQASWSDTWREKIRAMHADSLAALRELDLHISEHGC
jgi:hypothetical protein